VAGWQGLKTESCDIADLTPRAREHPPALRTMHFKEEEDEEDIPLKIGILERPTIYNDLV
jgi:hypothetical protein